MLNKTPSNRFRPQTLHHKLMLVLSLPMLLWIVSGCYFVWMDLSYIRGDHYQQPVANITLTDEHISFTNILEIYPNAESINLTMLADSPYYKIQTADGLKLVNANTALELGQIPKPLASNIAQAVMPAHIKPIAINAITRNSPSELASRHLPVWQVSFDDAVNSTIYVSMVSGDIVTRRHDFWRIFDLFWRIHIMDYDDGADIDNPVLLLTTLIAIVAIICGMLWQMKWLKRGRL